MEPNSIAHLWRSLRDRTMEKDAKEWGNKMQRASLKALREIFPEVDLRILKGTVLDHGDDVKGAVKFIVTEVLEQPFNEHMTNASVSEPVKDFSATNLTEPHVEEQNRGIADDKLIQMTELTVDTIDLDHFGLRAKFLDNISVEKRQGSHFSFRDEYEGTTFELQAESPSSTKGILIANMTGLESGTSDAALNPPYMMSESMTECRSNEMIFGEMSVQHPGDETDRGETLMNSQICDSPSGVEVKEEAAPLIESLYGSVLDVGIEADFLSGDMGTRRMEQSWSDGDKSEKQIVSRGSRWAYDSDDDYSDMQESKSSLVVGPSGQFGSMSSYADEGSRLMESSILDETTDGLFNSSSNSLINITSQQLSVDALEELVNDAKSDKDALTSAIEEMRLMRRTVELAESTAQQAKKAALNGGVDILAKVDEMHLMLDRARAANETRAGEVYGEKAVLGTESQELQRRLAQLKIEKDKAFAAVNEMRATLQARIDRANQEKEQAEAEKRQKEESALNLLTIENEFMAKVADESRNLDAEEEACTKLRDFLIDRGSIVDSLQGEVAVICEDVKAVQKQLDEGLLIGGSSFVQMMSSRSSHHSSVLSSPPSGAGSGILKTGDGGSIHSGALSLSGSSYLSATRAGEVEARLEDFSASELMKEVAKMTLLESDADQALQSQRSGPVHVNSDSGDDEGWDLLETSSAKSNRSSLSSSSVKRTRSEAFEF